MILCVAMVAGVFIGRGVAGGRRDIAAFVLSVGCLPLSFIVATGTWFAPVAGDLVDVFKAAFGDSVVEVTATA